MPPKRKRGRFAARSPTPEPELTTNHLTKKLCQRVLQAKDDATMQEEVRRLGAAIHMPEVLKDLKQKMKMPAGRRTKKNDSASDLDQAGTLTGEQTPASAGADPSSGSMTQGPESQVNSHPQLQPTTNTESSKDSIVVDDENKSDDMEIDEDDCPFPVSSRDTVEGGTTPVTSTSRPFAARSRPPQDGNMQAPAPQLSGRSSRDGTAASTAPTSPSELPREVRNPVPRAYDSTLFARLVEVRQSILQGNRPGRLIPAHQNIDLIPKLRSVMLGTGVLSRTRPDEFLDWFIRWLGAAIEGRPVFDAEVIRGWNLWVTLPTKCASFPSLDDLSNEDLRELDLTLDREAEALRRM